VKLLKLSGTHLKVEIHLAIVCVEFFAERPIATGPVFCSHVE
jgi:hypothetical protein